MTIQDWGAIGEIVGGLAVVASLIYLAMQIRQNTRKIGLSLESAKLAAFERNIDSGNRMRELFVTNPEIAALFLRGVADFHGLDAADKFRCDMLFRNVFSSLHGGFMRQQVIGGDPEGFAGSQRVIDTMLVNAGIREWLAEADPDWRPEFAAFAKTRLDASTPPESADSENPEAAE